MISNTIKSTLTAAFNMNVVYFSVVKHNQNQYFILIGSTSILFLTESFDQLEAKIAFQCIDRLIVSSKDPYLFQIHFNAKRPKNVPAKMNIHCLERRPIIRFIRFGWKTDYMYKYLEVRELPTYKAEFKDYTYQIEMLLSPQMELLELQETQKFAMFSFHSYNMFLPNIYSNTKKGVYTCNKFGTDFVLQISEVEPLEVLKHIGERIELQYYAEAYIQSVCAAEPFWIIDSSVYFKRKNLYYDLAEWSGWQIHARTIHNDIILIIQRRKYHPPLLENFQDIALIFYGPKGFKSMQDQKNAEEEDEQIEEDELEKKENEEDDEDEEEGEGKANAGENYLASIQQIYNESYVQNLVREAADTIYYAQLSPQDPSYRAFIKLFCDNLIYDEDCMRFMQWKHNIISKYETEARKVITLLQNMIAKPDINAENLPTEYIKNFINKIQFQEDGRRVFNYKFSRYLGYCLDGGIYPDFNFVYFVEKLQVSYKVELSRLLDYCLFSVSESTGTQTDFMIDENYKKISKIVSQRYQYNDRIMNTLLETSIFREELLKKDTKQQLYVDLMIHLLLNGKTCRAATCKHIINYQVHCKDQLTEQIVNLLKGLVSPLLIVYQSDYAKLSTLACVAIYNMCANSKEFKYCVMKENGLPVIIQKLRTQNQNLLNYTLRLIYSLMTIVQNIETFVQLGLVEKLFNILKENPIPGAFYSAQVQTICLKIITKCVSKDNDYKESISIFINIVVRESDLYFLEYQLIDQLKAEGLNTIFRICSINETDVELFTLIQQQLVPYLLEIIKQKLDNSLKQSLVKILCLIIKIYNQIPDEWNKEEMGVFLTEFEKAGVPNAAYLMQYLEPEK